MAAQQRTDNQTKRTNFMDARLQHPVLYRGRELSISARTRVGSTDMIVFLHGFGCSGESFASAFQSDVLSDFSLCAIDFPSHGSSSALDPSATSLQAYAEIVRLVIDGLPARRLSMVCHSMGSAAGLMVAKELTRLATFVSVEGNLVQEDCGIVSRETAAQSQEEFVGLGFGQFLDRLTSSGRPDHLAWAEWYARCDPAGLHQISRSLVEWSDRGTLLDLYKGLRNQHYIYGSNSRLDYLKPLLAGVPTYEIPQAGHFVMIDNPTEFYDLVSQIVSVSHPRKAVVRKLAGILSVASPSS